MREAHARAIIHAGRNVDLEFSLHLPVALSPALCTRRPDDLSRAAAVTAGAPHRQKALLIHNFATPVACRARCSAASRLGAFAGAAIAQLRARHLDLGGHAE